MPAFAQFVALSDSLMVLPEPISGDHHHHFEKIELAGLDSGRTVILTFKLKVSGKAHLAMSFNKKPNCIDYNFDPPEPESTRPRSWHEIIPGSDLKASNNELVVTTSGQGRVEFSDIVLLYHANSA
ncbi:hypothetical protein [Streptomyces sp. SID12501]|uniref:Uncharacterized protein n=1 Tax=Streptomyces sp. SID12501 TaxID=2706042 RepID=A0A6B3C851_9ACTN|nr:hypothetical protein [Streptomyces sp. SID12501]NEC92644.1 hypothetical protein [Streptomyces sp. SID12501]